MKELNYNISYVKFIILLLDDELEQLMPKSEKKRKKLLRKRRKNKSRSYVRTEHNSSTSFNDRIAILQVNAQHITHKRVTKVPVKYVSTNKSIFEQSTLQYRSQKNQFLQRLPQMDTLSTKGVAQPMMVGQLIAGQPTLSVHPPTQHQSPKKSVSDLTPRVSHQGTALHHAADELVRVIKIFLSERQSSVITDMGKQIPCAPPATPMPGKYNSS